MSVRVPHQKTDGAPFIILPFGRDVEGKRVPRGRCSGYSYFGGIVHPDFRMPRNQIVRACVWRQVASTRRRNVFKKLDAGPAGTSQAGDVKTRPKGLVQVLLFYPVVFTLTRHV